MNQVLGRGRGVSMMIGLLAIVLFAPALAPAQAAPATAERATSATDRVVMKNEFGKVRSYFTQDVGRRTVTGNFTPRRFKVTDAGEMAVVGVVRAQLTRADGKVVRQAKERQTLTVLAAEGAPLRAAAGTGVARAAATCDILNLDLGPLDLDLLGLEISLERVVLDIIARTGAGNLLGNLLCAVTGLLDGGLPGLLGEISNILNSILAILRL